MFSKSIKTLGCLLYLNLAFETIAQAIVSRDEKNRFYHEPNKHEPNKRNNSLSLGVIYFSDFQLYTSYEFAYSGGCATVSELHPSIIKTENTETVYQCYQFCKVTQQCAYFEYITGHSDIAVLYSAIQSQEGRIF